MTQQETRDAPCLTVRIVTLFPEILDSWLTQGLVARALEKGILAVEPVPLRPHGVGRHHITDDYSFGGGIGMVMKPEPLFAAVESIPHEHRGSVILLSPRGRRFDQRVAEQLATHADLTLLAGHYEGVDERVRQHLADDEISIGDYVLSSGELAAMVVADAVARLLPGALTEGGASDESFSSGLLEYPQYTRPAVFRDWAVPDVLLSGHHVEIARWRRQQALITTAQLRPDLLREEELSDDECELVRRYRERDEGTE